MEDVKQQAAQQPITTVDSSRGPNAKLMGLGAVLLLAIGAAGGYFFANSNKQAPAETVNQVTQSSPTETLPSPTPETMADWTTYENTTGGNSVKYPSSYTLETSKPSNNIPATDVSFIPENYSSRATKEFIGTIYVQKEKETIPANATAESVIKNIIAKDSHYASIVKSIRKDTIGGMTVYRGVTTADGEKSSITFVVAGNNLYRVLFQAGGGFDPSRPAAHQAVNYSDYEGIIASIKAL